MVMGVIDGEQELSRLWEERSDFTIVPTREDRFTISGEEDAVALKSGNLDSEELLSGLGVPYSNVVQGGGGEELGVALREANVVDSLIVAGVSQLWGDLVSIAPVDGSLGGSTEKVGLVSSQRD